MPYYRYACECGYSWEEAGSMDDDPMQPCPACGEEAERVFFPVNGNVKGGTPTHHQRAWLRGPGGSS